MINQIYIENEVKDHPRVQSILKKFQKKSPIYVDRYASVFNKKNQNFRIQKKYPSLILAQKKNGYFLQTPSDFGIGNSNNFEEAVIKAVNLGGNSNTVGAITGQLAGAMYGMESIPIRWFDKLLKIEKVTDVAMQMVELSRSE